MSIEITVRCDVCDRAGDSRTNARGKGGGPSAIGQLRAALERAGWRTRRRGAGRDLCPDCSRGMMKTSRLPG